jgi:glucose/arabinose dehydrogenase
MHRLMRLTVFAILVGALVFGGAWLFREPLLRAAGISFDRGLPGETALALLSGRTASVFASGLDHPRFMAVAPDGTLLVAEQGEDRVIALPDRDGDG